MEVVSQVLQVESHGKHELFEKYRPSGHVKQFELSAPEHVKHVVSHFVHIFY